MKKWDGRHQPDPRSCCAVKNLWTIPALILMVVWGHTELTVVASASELPRQQRTTKPAIQTPRQIIETGSGLTAGEAPETNRAASIEKLLAALDRSSQQSDNAVSALISALGNTETPPSLRERIAIKLGRVGEPARAAVPVLIGILRNFEPAVSASVEVHETNDETCYWAMKSLGLFGVMAADSVPEVRRILVNDQTPSQLRLLAADTLGQIRSPAAIGILIDQLMQPRCDGSNDETVRRQVMIDSLALAGPLATGAVPALARATEDDHAAVRRKACQALGAIGPQADGGMSALLERLVLDDDASVKDAAAVAMGQLGQAAIPVLVDLLERGDADLQWRAARALGLMGTTAKVSIPQLQTQLQHSDDRVRIEAADALLKVSLDARLVAATLVKELSNDDRQIRRRASEILINIRQLPDGVSEQLRKLLESGSTNTSRAAAYVLRKRNRQRDQ